MSKNLKILLGVFVGLLALVFVATFSAFDFLFSSSEPAYGAVSSIGAEDSVLPDEDASADNLEAEGAAPELPQTAGLAPMTQDEALRRITAAGHQCTAVVSTESAGDSVSATCSDGERYRLADIQSNGTMTPVAMKCSAVEELGIPGC